MSIDVRSAPPAKLPIAHRSTVYVVREWPLSVACREPVRAGPFLVVAAMNGEKC